jgi:hypothetical protein
MYQVSIHYSSCSCGDALFEASLDAALYPWCCTGFEVQATQIVTKQKRSLMRPKTYARFIFYVYPSVDTRSSFCA